LATVSTQALADEQNCWFVVGQRQVLAEQICVAPQARPHCPQLAASVDRVTQRAAVSQ
jgi:hypothetical protein